MEETFKAYTKGKNEIDGVKFNKMCKDAKIVTKTFTTTDTDIIFAKCKQKTVRVLTYEEFEKALQMVAEKKKVPYADIEAKIASLSGPQISGTSSVSASVVDRLTDSKQYTGAHKHRFDEEGKGKGLEGRESVAKGGGHIPSKALGSPGTLNMADITDRSEADVRGINKSASASAASATKRPSTAKMQKHTGPAESLAELFNNFCSISGGSTKEMDGKKFVKLFKDCKVLTKSFTSTSVDIIFAKVKDRSARTINLQQFEKALELVATEKGIGYDELVDRLLEVGGPTVVGTAAAASGIYDKLTDTSKYTGSHKERFDEEGKGRGIAGRTQKTSIAGDLSDQLDRSPADLRGNKY